MKKIKLSVLLLALLLVFAACGQKPAQQADSDEIIIGTLGPLTGNVAIYGIATTNGIKQAIDEINENGGILGKKVKLILEDEKGDTQEAMSIYNKLIEAGAQVIIGDHLLP